MLACECLHLYCVKKMRACLKKYCSNGTKITKSGKLEFFGILCKNVDTAMVLVPSDKQSFFHSQVTTEAMSL